MIIREATDKLGVWFTPGPRIDCQIAKCLRKIGLVVVTMSSRQISLRVVRVHGERCRRSKWHTAFFVDPCITGLRTFPSFAVVCFSILPRSFDRFSSDPPLLPVVCFGEFP